MTMTPVGSTARWIAAARALETESASPLFIDPYARALAGDAGFAVFTAARSAYANVPDDMPDAYLSIRTRFFDDALGRVVAAPALRQVVILASGMDTRAFRLQWPSRTVLFEIDRTEIFDVKESVLARAGAVPRCDRRVVEADFAGAWQEALLAAGFDPSRPAAFLVEGLLMYLPADAVTRVFDVLGTLAVDGSWIGLDVVNRDMMTSPFTKAYMDRLSELGCPWVFGTDDPERMLTAHGWNPTVVSPGDSEANYGRFPFPVTPRHIPGVPRTFLVTATRERHIARNAIPHTRTAHITRSAPYFLVPDVRTASAYYREVLGFPVEYDAGEEFAIHTRGASTIMLRRAPDAARVRPNAQQGGTWDVFLWVDDVNAMHEELAGRGAEIVHAPVVQPYGMKEFAVRDPNGYVLGFGQPWQH